MIKELSVFENSDINEIALKLEKGFNAINGILVVLNKENNIIGSISDGDFRRHSITNSLNFINCNGIIVLDDYGVAGWWNDGITKAVNFFQKKNSIKITRKHNLFDYHNQCIIKKI